MINYQRLDGCMSQPNPEWFWSKFTLAPDDDGTYYRYHIYQGYLKNDRQQTFIVPNRHDNLSAKLSLKIIPNNIMIRHHETDGYRLALLNNLQTVSFAALLNTVMLIEAKKTSHDHLLSEKEIAAKLTKLKALNDYDLYLALLPELTPRQLLLSLEPFALDNDIDTHQSSFKKTDKNNVYHFNAVYYRHYYLRIN